MSNKILVCYLILIVVILGCSKQPTGEAIKTEPDIYEDVSVEQQEVVEEEEQQVEQIIRIKTEEEFYNRTIEEQPKQKTEEFKFSPDSIVSTQNNISISIDNIKHEIKSVYWGKMVEITTTILNKGNKAFKPKVLVLLYDEADFKEEWFKPKAEIDFNIEKLNIGEHITRQAIVNIAFDNLTLIKNFKLVLVDAADPGNKALVVAEKEFKAENTTN